MPERSEPHHSARPRAAPHFSPAFQPLAARPPFALRSPRPGAARPLRPAQPAAAASRSPTGLKSPLGEAAGRGTRPQTTAERRSARPFFQTNAPTKFTGRRSGAPKALPAVPRSAARSPAEFRSSPEPIAPRSVGGQRRAAHRVALVALQRLAPPRPVRPQRSPLPSRPPSYLAWCPPARPGSPLAAAAAAGAAGASRPRRPAGAAAAFLSRRRVTPTSTAQRRRPGPARAAPRGRLSSPLSSVRPAPRPRGCALPAGGEGGAGGRLSPHLSLSARSAPRAARPSPGRAPARPGPAAPPAGQPARRLPPRGPGGALASRRRAPFCPARPSGLCEERVGGRTGIAPFGPCRTATAPTCPVRQNLPSCILLSSLGAPLYF